MKSLSYEGIACQEKKKKGNSGQEESCRSSAQLIVENGLKYNFHFKAKHIKGMPLIFTLDDKILKLLS